MASTRTEFRRLEVCNIILILTQLLFTDND